MTNKQAIEKINRILRELSVRNAFDMPSFWTNNMSKYVVINDKYHKGYQQALEDAESRIKEIFEEAENE